MIIAILFFLLILLLGSFWAYSIAFHAPVSKRPSPDIHLVGAQYEAVSEHLNRISGIMRRYSYEDVSIRSHDGLTLHGRYYHFKDQAPLQILFHGYRSHPYRDCCGGHSLARKMGYNILVIDQRAHGRSDGSTISFGILERFDCLDWVNYAAERFGKHIPIVLSGLSMGAATVLMATELPLPRNVACVIADSPYSSPAAIIEKVCADKHYPVCLCRPFIHLAPILFGKFRLSAATARDAVRKSNVPILLIHGEADHFVPCDMTLEIATNCASRVEVVTFPGAGHGLSYISDPIRYEKAVCHFLLSIPSLQGTIDEAYLTQLNENI